MIMQIMVFHRKSNNVNICECQCISLGNKERVCLILKVIFVSTFNQPQKVKVNNYITIQKFGFSI